jgi:hypothetical protein
MVPQDALTYEELNLRLVQLSVRPAWQSEWPAAQLRRRIEQLGMAGQLTLHSVRVKGERERVLLVTRSSMDMKIPKDQTHASIGRILGLPCSSEQAWFDPAACYGFSVEAIPTQGGACKDVRPGPGLYITSFWCKSSREGLAWVRKFRRDARHFERDFLNPRGLRLAAHIKRPVF